MTISCASIAAASDFFRSDGVVWPRSEAEDEHTAGAEACFRVGGETSRTRDAKRTIITYMYGLVSLHETVRLCDGVWLLLSSG